VEGKNIVVEYRHAEGKQDGLPAVAAELVPQNGGHRHPRSATHSCAKELTVTIPFMAQGCIPDGSVTNSV
jgi:hypothetical protein